MCESVCFLLYVHLYLCCNNVCTANIKNKPFEYARTHAHTHTHTHTYTLIIDVFVQLSCRELSFQDVPGSTHNVSSNTHDVLSNTTPSNPNTSTPAPMIRQRTHSRLDTSSFFLDHFLSENMMEYLLKLKQVSYVYKF